MRLCSLREPRQPNPDGPAPANRHHMSSEHAAALTALCLVTRSCHTDGNSGHGVGPGLMLISRRWRSSFCSHSRRGSGLPKREHRTPGLQVTTGSCPFPAPIRHGPRGCLLQSSAAGSKGVRFNPLETHEAETQEALMDHIRKNTSWVFPRGNLATVSV